MPALVLAALLAASGCGRPVLEPDPTGTLPAPGTTASTGSGNAGTTTASTASTATGTTPTTGNTGTVGGTTTGTGGTTPPPANHPPEAPVVAIEPAAPVEGDDLACVVEEPSVDRDGDAVTYHFAWELDGASTPEKGEVVSGLRTDAGETWTCIVTPDDGKDTGAPASASVVVGPGCSALDLSTGRAEHPADARLELGTGAGAGWTVEAWVYLPSWWTRDMVLLWKGVPGEEPDDATADYGLRIDRERAALLWVTGGEGPCAALEGIAPWAGSWTHLAATLEATGPTSGTKRFFVDGMEVASCAYSDKAEAVSGPLVLGAALDAAGLPVDPWDGIVDELRISSVARYASDFSPAPFLASDADTVALWHFDDGSGATAGDAGPSGLDLDLLGASWSAASTCDL